MPSFDVDREQIAAFDLGGRYVFKQYFNEDDLFQQLEKYYNRDRYRFEISDDDLPKVRQILDKYFYDIEIVENFNDFCVIRDRQLDSSKILRDSVTTHHQGKFEIFLMKDKLSARQAVEKGATPIQKSDLSLDQIQWEIDGS
jgi:hypothetical protein